MGEAATYLFGGKHAKSTSNTHNQAYPYLKGALGGTIGQGTDAGSAIANLLGLSGSAAQTQGFDNWRNSTGYQFGMDQGMQAITGGAASKGLLNSGATLKALNTFGQDYASTKYGDYMGQLSGLLDSGLTGAGILAGAGNVSNSKSKEIQSDGGPGKFLGSLMGK